MLGIKNLFDHERPERVVHRGHGSQPGSQVDNDDGTYGVYAEQESDKCEGEQESGGDTEETLPGKMPNAARVAKRTGIRNPLRQIKADTASTGITHPGCQSGLVWKATTSRARRIRRRSRLWYRREGLVFESVPEAVRVCVLKEANEVPPLAISYLAVTRGQARF
jgi:hypothetical protein